MVKKQTVCLRRLGEDRAKEVCFGRFLKNTRVRCQEMLEYASQRIGKVATGLHVLAIQDTTEVNYQAHANKVSGLGKAGNGKDAGFFLHPVIAVDSQSQALLGICCARIWQRFQKEAPHYKQLPLEEKESYRWLEGADKAKAALAQARCVTIIGDRESDIYQAWVHIPDEKTHLLIRAGQNRLLAGGVSLFDYARQLEAQGHFSLNLPARPGQPARQATLAVSFSKITLQRPQHTRDKNLPASCQLSLVQVQETTRSAGEKPIHWILLTTHPLDSVEKAQEVIGWYKQRWQIEQVFRTLKRQGLHVESSQIETAQALEKLAVLALLGAVRCLQLVGARAGKLHRPASDVFDPEETELLRTLQPKLEGKTQKQKNPHPKESLAWGTWLIARLGGWKGYASESPPGPITMHNGLKAFSHMLEGWLLAKLVCID